MIQSEMSVFSILPSLFLSLDCWRRDDQGSSSIFEIALVVKDPTTRLRGILSFCTSGQPKFEGREKREDGKVAIKHGRMMRRYLRDVIC